VLIGAAAGAALGLIPDYYDDCEECHDSLYASTAVGEGVGLLIDALRVSRRVVYETPTTGRPMHLEVAVGRHAVGLRAIVRWR